MDKPQYPEDLLIEIIHKFAEVEVARQDWLRLRRVNSGSCKHPIGILTSPQGTRLTMSLHRAFQPTHTLYHLCA